MGASVDRFDVVVRGVSFAVYMVYDWDFETEQFLGLPVVQEVVNTSTYEIVDVCTPLGIAVTRATLKEVVKLELKVSHLEQDNGEMFPPRPR